MDELIIHSNRTAGCRVLNLQGEAGIKGSQILRDAIEKILRDGEKRIALNLSGLSLLSSVGLSMLIKLNQEASQSGGSLSILCPPQHIREVFSTTGTDQVFRIYENQEALEKELDA